MKQASCDLQVAAENSVGFKCSDEAASSTEFALSCPLQASVLTTELVSCLLPIGHAQGTPNPACLQQLLNIAINCPLCLSSLHGGQPFPFDSTKAFLLALHAPMCRCLSFLPTLAFGAFRALQASMTGKALASSVMSSRLIMLLPSLSAVCVCESLRQKPLTQQPLLPPRVELPPTVELLPRLRVFLTPAASSRQPDTAWTLCLA